MQHESEIDPSAVKGFWTGEMILAKREDLFNPSREDGVECAAYVLRMGEEVYVSPDDQTANAKNITVRTLALHERFTIPPGQFAFLLTEEFVTVPDTVVAFISMKAKVKWKGLINVSGFHADPGFKGKLIFAVFNAGPVVIHLSRGDDLFLIWFADLASSTQHTYKKPPQMHIHSDLVNGLSGELQSLPGLATKIRELEKTFDDRIHQIEKAQEGLNVRRTAIMTVVGAIFVGLLLVVIRIWVPAAGEGQRSNSPAAPPSNQQTQGQRIDSKDAVEPTGTANNSPVDTRSEVATGITKAAGQGGDAAINKVVVPPKP